MRSPRRAPGSVKSPSSGPCARLDRPREVVLGLSFLEAGETALPREPGLYVGLRDGPANLCRKAERIGIDLAARVRDGLLDIVLLASPGLARAEPLQASRHRFGL